MGKSKISIVYNFIQPSLDQMYIGIFGLECIKDDF